jgi:hypothetical protein
MVVALYDLAELRADRTLHGGITGWVPVATPP